MKVAFVVQHCRQASGTGYHIAQSLAARGVEVERIGGLKYQKHPLNILKYVVNERLFGKRDHPHRDPGFLRHFSAQVEAWLAELDGVDLVVASGGLPIAYLETDLPLVLWTDCTFASLLDYYARFSNLSERTIRDGHAAEQSLFDRIDAAILTSAWAADSAVNDYGFDRDRICVINRGANIADIRNEADTERLITARRDDDTIRLIWIGNDWERKRGRLAVDVARLLHEQGHAVELTIVGAQADFGSPPPYVTTTGYLNKQDPDDARRLETIFGRSHYLLLPTLADCTPIVLAEAASFAVPAMTTNTGAVPSVTQHEQTGFIVEIADGPEVYAEYITRGMADRDAYDEMARAAFADYRTRLNWTSVAERAEAFLATVLRSVRTGDYAYENRRALRRAG